MVSQDIVNVIVPILKRHQVVRASVFGSFATGSNRSDSDLDLRIEFPEGKSYFDLVELEFELESALGRKVDLVTYNTILHPIVLEGILKEQIPLFLKKNPQVYIDHILDSVRHISDYTSGLSKEEFLKSDQIQDAVFRRLEIIGEAAMKLPDELKQGNPDIPWRDIIGTRNRLIHDYLQIDKDLIWQIKHLPELKQKISDMSDRLNI